MAAVRSKDTGPELLVRRFLWSKGMRYRVHPENLPGTPDIAVRRHRLAIFVHGCFWHGHENCPKGRLPKSRLEYWNAKIDANRRRDEAIALQLRRQGWLQVVVWACQLSTRQSAATALPKLWNEIRQICPEVGSR